MAWAKLQWARFRLHELDEVVERHVREAAHPIYHESDSRARRFKLVWSPASTEGHFGLRAGDIAHSLRSALDVLVWGLTVDPESFNRPRPSFPIFDSEAAYDSWGQPKVRGMEQLAQEIVRSHQPFRWPQGAPSTDPLSVLGKLNDVDKHRVPHSVLIGLEIEEDSLAHLIDLLTPRLQRPPFSIPAGQVVMPDETIAEFQFKDEASMAFEYEPYVYARSVDIAFEDRTPVMATLNEIGIRVEGVIRTFENACRDGKLTYR